MTHVEQRTFLPPVIEQKSQSRITLPKLQVDRTVLTEQGYHSAGIGILLLSRNPDGEVFLVLGKHKATDRTSDGLWGWFGETLKEDSDGKIEPTDQAVRRCFQEELGIPDIEPLRLRADAEKLVTEVDLTAHRVKTGSSIKYRIAAHIFWVEDAELVPPVQSDEIDGVKSFPLREIVDGTIEVPLREFTAPVILDLLARGYLENPGEDRLLNMSFPLDLCHFSQLNHDLTV